MKGLFAKSLISVAEAVSTILTPEFIVISVGLSEGKMETKILYGYIKHYRFNRYNSYEIEVEASWRKESNKNNVRLPSE